MDPVFTLPYSEFVVAQQLAQLLPAKLGFSIHTPLSRQQKGVDLVVLRRRGRHSWAKTIQVKSSRTYSHRPATKMKRKSELRKFRFYTWLKTFDCSPEADFFCLVALYPSVDVAEHRERGSWWSPQILVFTQMEMRRLLRSIRTAKGKPDSMFGFGFDTADEVVQTRGYKGRKQRDFSRFLLSERIGALRRALGAR